MRAHPKVSVLMTLYNKGPYVAEAVQSVLAQTFTDFELLVVDDASTDGGLQRVKALIDPRIHILESAANTGRAAAANRGYDRARGEYIAVLDADDLMVPERLALQVEYMDAHPEVGVLGGWGQMFGAQDALIEMPAEDNGARGIMLFGMPVLYPSCMLRRSVLETHGVRCPTDWHLPGMDRLFILAVGKHTKYANLQQVLYHYRIGRQNMRHGRNAVADMQHLYRAVFHQLGFEVSEDEIVLQTFLNDLGGAPPTIRQAMALHRWMGKLRSMNRRQQVLPVAEFEAELERRWDWLFHRTVTRASGAAFAHMLLSHTLRDRFGYWAKATKDKWTGTVR